ncbi:ATP-binding protein [Streptomyces sp. NBC_00073]|uniref:nSTAND1 domain-containing NTPase n=1 Tax=Streptomyces sp. NBC_00073 TaxID=2975640 RepID=UPI003865529F
MRREGFVVKVRSRASEVPAGVGFMVGPNQLVTCAHVVNVALGRTKEDRTKPSDRARIQVEFVLLGDAEGGPLRNCRIDAWDPPPGGGSAGRDVAGLTIVGGDLVPVGAGAARLLDSRLGDAGGGEAAIFGYPGVPPREVNGAWTACLLRGAVGGGLIQLDSGGESALRAQPGYSGTPVITSDRWGDAVVGMLAVASHDGAEGDAYAVPVAEVVAAWPEVLGRSALPACPYRGLQAFTAQDAEAGYFVGREREVDRLRDMVRVQPLVVVTGPSGVGKSSLVAAGLQPALAGDGWSVATFRPGSSAFAAVARALLVLEQPDTEHSLDKLEQRIRALRVEGFWAVANKVALLAGRRIALVCDQFEEVLNGGPASPEPLEFLQAMFPPPDTAQSEHVRLICTLRADFLPDLLSMPDVGPRLQDRQLNVSPLDEEALSRVIIEPAAMSRVTFTPGLAAAIAAEAGRSSGSLPLLEFALTELWPLQEDRRISFDSYYSLGGVSGALNQHAEKAYHLLSEHVPAARIRRVLLAMVRARGGAKSAVRVTAQRSHLGEDWYVAQLLAAPDIRLVVIGPGGPATAEIAHEALIREWRRLATWVDEDADFQQWLAVLEERASEGDLLSATRVAEAQRWLGERRPDIPQAVVNLIEHSSSVILEQQKTRRLLSESQEITEQLRERSAELERRQRDLQVANSTLEEKAELLAQENRNIESRIERIEEARQVLEERAEQLAVSMRHKSNFVATMSHELRTPLNSLLILARLLAENREGNLSPREVDFSKTIHRAGSDLLQLVSDILDQSRIETGRMDVTPTRTTFAEVVDYVVSTFDPLAMEKGLKLSARVTPGTPAGLYTDEGRLLQVLRNLLSNAVTFTPEGSVELVIHTAAGDVPPEVKQMMLAAGSLRDADEEVIAFSVIDTGIGVAEEHMEAIFEAFRQADRTVSRTHGGTGLGLTLSREIARLLGGEIHAVSRLAAGSTFTLYLPFGSLPEEGRSAASTTALPAPDASRPRRPEQAGRHVADPPSTPTAAPGAARTRVVLLVDDDVRTAFALVYLLETSGYTVLFAENAKECIQLLNDGHEVDVILMDDSILAMDGYATMTAIRQTPHLSATPVVALSSKSLPGDREKALSAGAADYLTKPVDGGSILSILARSH